MHYFLEAWLSTSLQIVTIVVLIVTCWAAWRQASAAHELTKATKQQIETTKAMADSANAQAEFARRQFEEGLRPFLTLVDQMQGQIPYIAVRNVGAGPALECFFCYDRADSTFPKKCELESDAIAPGQEVGFPRLEWHKAQEKGLVFVCRSITGQPCATEYIWHGKRQSRCRYIMSVPERLLNAEPDGFESTGAVSASEGRSEV